MPDKRAPRKLQLLGGVFPCGLRSKQIGCSTTDECPLCHKRETPSHILCGCRELWKIVTVSHDKIWGRLCEYARTVTLALFSWRIAGLLLDQIASARAVRWS
eukprot:514817-Rhodomonas_salina.1